MKELKVLIEELIFGVTVASGIAWIPVLFQFITGEGVQNDEISTIAKLSSAVFTIAVGFATSMGNKNNIYAYLAGVTLFITAWQTVLFLGLPLIGSAVFCVGSVVTSALLQHALKEKNQN
jgi:hypothetical protein